MNCCKPLNIDLKKIYIERILCLMANLSMIFILIMLVTFYVDFNPVGADAISCILAFPFFIFQSIYCIYVIIYTWSGGDELFEKSFCMRLLFSYIQALGLAGTILLTIVPRITPIFLILLGFPTITFVISCVIAIIWLIYKCVIKINDSCINKSETIPITEKCINEI